MLCQLEDQQIDQQIFILAPNILLCLHEGPFTFIVLLN